MLYRMSVTGVICFDVTAGSDEEAVKKAERVKETFSEGMDVSVDKVLDMRAYFDESDKPAIEDADEGKQDNA